MIHAIIKIIDKTACLSAALSGEEQTVGSSDGITSNHIRLTGRAD
ncbi:hypothetical protein CLOSTASPAR_04183 [[Clostridium] asparagiforme DSM 15981]|uniref:Uncharacterized protein n=1 Tax=[Clostridium] asparagiforme DSM 15981 TaxID=518636 RepID=C0D4I9_9FIRM|nr:hypothetical protein CLOSTASPAR_04183 [[Clostridium] asparagiforme DSM 15981]